MPLKLARPQGRHPDEIDQVADAINRMRERLLIDIQARSAVEAELASHRDHLEELVSARTSELQAKTRELEAQSAELRLARDGAEQALARLQMAQQQLVESEKMASLGQLVASVAHEVNTPLGVALTASSFLEIQSAKLRRDLHEDRLTRSTLHAYVDAATQSSILIQQNLERAARLVPRRRHQHQGQGHVLSRAPAVPGAGVGVWLQRASRNWSRK